MTATNGTRSRRWDEAYLIEIYDLAKEGLDDEEIAENLGVPFHVLRRWMRKQEALPAMLERARVAPTTTPYDEGGDGGGDGESPVQSKDEMANLIRDVSHLKPSQRRFLICYGQTINVTRAARYAGLARENHYRWLQEDPEYKSVFEQLDVLAVGALEDQAVGEAMGERRQYKFTQNGQRIMVPCKAHEEGAEEREDNDGNTYYVRHYFETVVNASMIMFLLKCKKPDIYRDKPIQINQNNLSANVGLNELLGMVEKRNNVIDTDAIEHQASRLIEEHSSQ